MESPQTEPAPEYGIKTFFALMMVPPTMIAVAKLLMKSTSGDAQTLGIILAICGAVLSLPCLMSCVEIAVKRWSWLAGGLTFAGIGLTYVGVLWGLAEFNAGP